MEIPVPPVLLIAFNRPNEAKRVFDQIRLARPNKLYFACDGPRSTKPGEIDLVNKVREIILEIDWPCEVKTRFLNENQGCGPAVSSAIEWFLNDAGEGIILEDDCLPTPAFFRFCSIMLDRYRKDESVGMISGSNLAPVVKLAESYTFSRIVTCWGWATWQRAWSGYRLQPNLISTDENWTQYILKRTFKKFELYIRKIKGGDIHTWDHQYMLHILRSNQLTVVPKENLVLNIGFKGQGAHYGPRGRPWWVPKKAIDTKENWSKYLTPLPNYTFDIYYQSIAHAGCSNLKRLWYKIYYFILGV